MQLLDHKYYLLHVHVAIDLIFSLSEADKRFCKRKGKDMINIQTRILNLPHTSMCVSTMPAFVAVALMGRRSMVFRHRSVGQSVSRSVSVRNNIHTLKKTRSVHRH